MQDSSVGIHLSMSKFIQWLVFKRLLLSLISTSLKFVSSSYPYLLVINLFPSPQFDSKRGKCTAGTIPKHASRQCKSKFICIQIYIYIHNNVK